MSESLLQAVIVATNVPLENVPKQSEIENVGEVAGI